MTSDQRATSSTHEPRRHEAPTRREYPYFRQINTRWMDVDVYGHVNNVVYYSYFDTAVNAYLTEGAGLDPRTDSIVGLVVENGCTFRQSLAFPETIDVGIRVAKIGTSSVIYQIGIFRQDDPTPAAFGYFVHVYVDRATQRPVPIPPVHRAAMEQLRPSD